MIVSLDHALGLIPLLSFAAFLLYASYSILVWFVEAACVAVKASSSSTPSDPPSKGNRATCTVVLMVAYALSPLVIDTSGLHDIVKGTDPSLERILQMAPSILKGPSPPLLLTNRHLQFIPWMIQNEIHNGDIRFQRIDFEVTACIDKSEPDCTPSSLMNDTITIDIFPPLQDIDSEFNKVFNRSSPMIFFQPGLRCFSQDMPGNMIIRRAYAEGFRSVVVNRRGHTPGRLLKAPRFNIFGDVEDLEQIYWHVKRDLAGPNTPFFLHGISSGTAVTVSSLSKWDRRRHENPSLPAPSFVASISVTPGYDISKALRPERFMFPYNGLMTPFVKEHFVMQNLEVLRSFNSGAVDAALSAATLQELVDAAAPFAGYPNASEYFRHENPVNELMHITTPKLVINALDDPCCHIDNLYEQSPYEHHDGKTYAEMVMESKHGIVAVTKTGSHCPFLDGFFPFVKDPLYGGWMLNSWADQVSIDFYRAALEVYGDRRYDK